MVHGIEADHSNKLIQVRLLPLLPPLARAQSLLLQMAFLVFANTVLISCSARLCQRNHGSVHNSSVGDADDDLSKTTVETRLKLSDILSHAHKISYTTFAPPEFCAGTAPLRGALPPAPQEEQMRASQLYNFADLDIGSPRTDQGKEKIIEPPLTESNPLASLSAIQGLNPSSVVVPPGWKPGMPVALPCDLILPPPPPGWKPGDPLPPLETLPLPPRVEEQQSRLVPPPGLTKAPEPIQVRHVLQLNIEDDSSEDFSSDDASSGSED